MNFRLSSILTVISYRLRFGHLFMQSILKSSKLTNVCYDIRGPVLDRAKLMEEEGQHIIKLNIGNPGAFGFDAPEEILRDVIHNLSDASGYCDSKGLFAAVRQLCIMLRKSRSECANGGYFYR